MANGVGFYSKSMHHYQQACRENPELSINDEKFQQRIKTMVQDFNSLRGGEGNSSTLVPSFDIIKEATICIRENNKKCADEILAYNQDLGVSTQILPMVSSYFELCQTTRDVLLRLQVHLCCTINKLMAFRGDRPVDEKVREAVTCAEGAVDCFFLSLSGLNQKHVQMLHKLQQVRDEEMLTRAGRATNPKIRRVIRIMLWTVFTGVVILSILAAFPHAPQVLAALSMAVNSIYGCGPFVKWVEGFWATTKEIEGVDTREKRIIVIRELEDIKLLMVCNRESQSCVEDTG
ncbi:UPF0496 protein At4g34320-like [Nymphaea colorata]|uniref:UPF0496 protein At4g34320-like n=1 Tax=Nymphaea colorata TaxID=210225 RepID=UPI00129D7600|nr:UPF0496 protein At4g34320-like [Nymphaea colorata]